MNHGKGTLKGLDKDNRKIRHKKTISLKIVEFSEWGFAPFAFFTRI